MARLHSCNVLQTGTDNRRFWRFYPKGSQFELAAEQSSPLEKPLPGKWVAKTVSSFWQQKMNVAWFPAEHVFLRVLHLPQCDFTELLSMVEFQLEKLSPLPVAQIVWTVELVPQAKASPDGVQTLVVVIVARGYVEQFLGDLEKCEYLADRLELPELHQLFATPETKDAAAVLYHQRSGDKNVSLVAWWHKGVLQNLSVLHLTTPDHWAGELNEQLTQVAWAGEIEGWLSVPPQWKVIATPDVAGVLEPLIREWSGQPVQLATPLAPAVVAERSARRADNPFAEAGLLPLEFIARYKQEFIDRLWMRSLGAGLILYLLVVGIYFGAVAAVKIQKSGIEDQITALKPDYRKTLETEARIQVLQNQINLRYAALDVMKVTAEELPKELTLTDMIFQKGKILVLTGMAGADDAPKITDFTATLAKAKINDRLVFTQVDPPQTRAGAAIGSPLNWSFRCELNLPETE